MKLIVGLGNPGDTYARTRHNVGFMVLDALATHQDVNFTHESKFGADVAQWDASEGKFLLAKPQTYMNNSGEAVQKIARFYKVPAEDIWAVYDDVDVPYGKLRTRLGGRAGGHQGVNSMIAHLGEGFGRIKVGISLNDRTREPSEIYVLKPFTTDEREQLPKVLESARQVVLERLQVGNLIEHTYDLLG